MRCPPLPMLHRQALLLLLPAALLLSIAATPVQADRPGDDATPTPHVALQWTENDHLIDYALDPSGQAAYALLESQPLAMGGLTVFLVIRIATIALALIALGLLMSLGPVQARRIGRLPRCRRCQRVIEFDQTPPAMCPGCGIALGEDGLMRGHRDHPAISRRVGLALTLLVLAGLGLLVQVQHVAWADRLWPHLSAEWGDGTADRAWFDAFRVPARRVVEFDGETGEIARTLLLEPDTVEADHGGLQRIAVSDDGTALFAAGPQGLFRIGLGHVSNVSPRQYHPEAAGAAVASLAADPQGRYVAMALQTGRIFLWQDRGGPFQITELAPAADREPEYGRDILALGHEMLMLIADGYEIAAWRYEELGRAALAVPAPDPDIEMLLATHRPWAAVYLDGHHYAGRWSYSWLDATPHHPRQPPRHPVTDRAEAVVVWDLGEDEPARQIRVPPRTLLGAFDITLDGRLLTAALHHADPDGQTRLVISTCDTRQSRWATPVASPIASVFDLRLSTDGHTALLAGRAAPEDRAMQLHLVRPQMP